MTVRIKAHFDGKTIVPDEPVSLPAGTLVTVEFPALNTLEPNPSVTQRLTALDELAAMAMPGLKISEASLLRENLYEDR
jgi:hypothetical protein